MADVASISLNPFLVVQDLRRLPALQSLTVSRVDGLIAPLASPTLTYLNIQKFNCLVPQFPLVADLHNLEYLEIHYLPSMQVWHF